MSLIRRKNSGDAWETAVEETGGGNGGTGAIKQTRVMFALGDIPVVDVPGPGDGAVVYTPEVGEMLLPQLCAVSIAAGDGFDGDYSLSFFIDGQQGVGGLGNTVSSGDEDADGDSTFADQGLTNLVNCGPAPTSGSPEAPFLNSGRWMFKTTDPIVALFTGGTPDGGEPATGGPITVILGTMPP